MKEKPILFSAPMVQAILDGRKAQTRRVIKPQPLNSDGEIYDGKIYGPELYEYAGYDKHGELVPMPEIFGIYDENGEWGIKCPYGQIGDQLWVRENGWERPYRTTKMMRDGADTWKKYYYDADGLNKNDVDDFKEWGFKRRPSIHMPRWASRIQLVITAVRIQRLNDISAEDAFAEGIKVPTSQQGGLLIRLSGKFPTCNYLKDAKNSSANDIAIAEYASLWESINGELSWATNPWVWVVEFKRIKQ